jgi:hypothetical protein
LLHYNDSLKMHFEEKSIQINITFGFPNGISSEKAAYVSPVIPSPKSPFGKRLVKFDAREKKLPPTPPTNQRKWYIRIGRTQHEKQFYRVGKEECARMGKRQKILLSFERRPKDISLMNTTRIRLIVRLNIRIQT